MTLALTSRCIKEYNQAVRMCEEKKCCVIVAGMEPCSRPPALKLFLYLDFIDNSKFSNVWIKLLETISEDVWEGVGCVGMGCGMGCSQRELV